MARQYSSIAQPMTLSAAVNSAQTSLVLNSIAGLPPATPFTLVIDRGLSSEEIVTVTAIAGTTVTVQRGQDGSGAQSHGMGAEVRHMMTARDLREPQQHLDATTGVHGLGVGVGVVGTSSAQTLTNKTMSGAQNTFSNIPQSAVAGLSTAFLTEQQARQAVATGLANEVTARTSAVSGEATARTNADNALSTRVTAIETSPTQWRATSATRPTGVKVKDSDLLYETDKQIMRIRESGYWRHLTGTPGFFAERSAAKNIGASTWTTIDAMSERYDDLDQFNASTGVFTVPVAGVWEFSVTGLIGTNAAATAIASRLVTGSGAQVSLGTYDLRYIKTAASEEQTTGFTAAVSLAENTQIRFQIWQNHSAVQGMTSFAFSGALRRAEPIVF